MYRNISMDIWSAEFYDNEIRVITDLSQKMSTQPSVTYQILDDALKAEFVKDAARIGGLSLEDFDYEYAEVVPNMGPTTPQCCFRSITNGKSYFSGVELWLASGPDSPGAAHASMLNVVINELVALAK